MKRRQYQPPSRAILLLDGPAVRLRDLSAWAGWSKAKLLAEARAGELVITWRKCGTHRWAFVEREEAHRYLSTMERFKINTAHTA